MKTPKTQLERDLDAAVQSLIGIALKLPEGHWQKEVISATDQLVRVGVAMEMTPHRQECLTLS